MWFIILAILSPYSRGVKKTQYYNLQLQAFIALVSVSAGLEVMILFF